MTRVLFIACVVTCLPFYYARLNITLAFWSRLGRGLGWAGRRGVGSARVHQASDHSRDRIIGSLFFIFFTSPGRIKASAEHVIKAETKIVTKS